MNRHTEPYTGPWYGVACYDGRVPAHDLYLADTVEKAKAAAARRDAGGCAHCYREGGHSVVLVDCGHAVTKESNDGRPSTHG